MHNFCVIFLVIPTIIVDIVLVGFLEISSPILPMIFKVMEAYEVEHLPNILVYEFKYITKKGRMCIIKDSFPQARAGCMDRRYSETPQSMTTECDIECPSFHRRSLLPATYSTIL
jgi:hypothetical protein